MNFVKKRNHEKKRKENETQNETVCKPNLIN